MQWITAPMDLSRLRLRSAVALLALVVVMAGLTPAVTVVAQDPPQGEHRGVEDPCVDPAEVPPPPPPPLELEPPGPGASDAEVEAYIQSRAAAQEAAGGVDPAEVPPPPPDYPPDWQAGDDAEVPPPCLSYRVVEIPGGRSWSGACIDSLARGPIVLKWRDPSGSGIFTLRPASETNGSITEVLTGKGPGYSFKYQGKGRYRIEVVQQTAAGAPELLDVVYATKGRMKQCVGGNCISSKMDGDEALIPLEAHQGTCKSAR